MRLSCVERPQSFPANHSHLGTDNWFSDPNDCDQKEDPEATFTVLDSILKSSLDRLASLRFMFDHKFCILEFFFICELIMMKPTTLLLL